MATAVGLLLVLLTGGGAMALTGIGPGAGLLGASESERIDQSSTTQPPAVEEDAATEEESVEEEATEKEESARETPSLPNDSTETSGTSPDDGNAGQLPAAQTDKGSQTAGVPSGNPEQDTTTRTKEKDSSSVEVPNLTGLSVSDATSKLAAEGLTLGSRREAPSDNVAPGKVISQHPAPGTKVKKGSSVSIVCSCGEPQQKDTPPPQQKGASPAQQKDAPPQQQQKSTSPSQQKGNSPSQQKSSLSSS